MAAKHGERWCVVVRVGSSKRWLWVGSLKCGPTVALKTVAAMCASGGTALVEPYDWVRVLGMPASFEMPTRAARYRAYAAWLRSELATMCGLETTEN